MLDRISIRNYIIIESQEIAFSDGLNIITGDTGAGKSIILEGLTLVLGARAESGVLLDPSKKAVIEAIFTHYPKDVDRLLSENDVDLGDEIIMRREILPSGKSRAFVNDTPVRLDFMRTISGALIDLHQQFETLEIQHRDMQFEVLDAFAGTTGQVKTYGSLYAKHSALRSRVNRLTDERAKAHQERDYIEYQMSEISEVMPEKGQMAEWEETYNIQEHAEDIRNSLMSAIDILRDSDRAIIDTVGQLASSLGVYKSQDVQSLSERLISTAAELEDIVGEMSTLESRFEADPQLKAELEEKLDAIRKLFFKHGLKTEEALIELADSFQAKLDGWEEISSDLESAIQELDQTLYALKQSAATLHDTREEYAPLLAGEVSDMLSELEMKNARFRIDVQATDEINERGSDLLDFMFAANKGSEFEPVGKVASGGELSRLSLCIKSVVCKKMQLPSMVFDEIDAGVSGQVALKMGEMLRQLAADQQVIMITHSPQIAANARLHLRVEKYDTSDRSYARVAKLDEEQRILEVAKMLSGDPPTQAAIMNAKELIIQ